MLGLKLPTDPRWVDIAESNLPEILTDHAYCEQKAASTAISLIVKFPECSDLVAAMSDLAMEEMDHFRRVHALILKRGWVLGRERKDDYVNELFKIVRTGYSKNIVLVDRLLFSAMVEARSCERFRLLSEGIKDKELADFYRELMASEAGHYTLFIGFARQYAEGVDVEKRWQEFLDYEAGIIAGLGNTERMHG